MINIWIIVEQLKHSVEVNEDGQAVLPMYASQELLAKADYLNYGHFARCELVKHCAYMEGLWQTLKYKL